MNKMPPSNRVTPSAYCAPRTIFSASVTSSAVRSMTPVTEFTTSATLPCGRVRQDELVTQNGFGLWWTESLSHTHDRNDVSLKIDHSEHNLWCLRQQGYLHHAHDPLDSC